MHSAWMHDHRPPGRPTRRGQAGRPRPDRRLVRTRERLRSGVQASLRDRRAYRATRSTRPRRDACPRARIAGSARRRRRVRARGGRRTRPRRRPTIEASRRRTPSARGECSRSSSVHRSRPSAPSQKITPDHGRVLEERLLLGRERVDPGGNDPLHRLGNDGLGGTLDVSMRANSSAYSGFPPACSSSAPARRRRSPPAEQSSHERRRLVL